MAHVNQDDTRMILHIPDHAPITTEPLTLSYAPRNVRYESMTYYYRRGGKYFFRGGFGRLVITHPVFDEGVKLKRGEIYQVKMTFKD